MRPSTASPIYLYAYFQRILGVSPSTLALAESRDTATHTARDSDLGSGGHDMSGLSALAYLNDSSIHGLTDIPLAYFQRTLGGTLALAPRTDTQHHNFGHTNTLHPHGHQTTYMHILSMLVGLRTSTWPLVPSPARLAAVIRFGFLNVGRINRRSDVTSNCVLKPPGPNAARCSGLPKNRGPN
jgi:hypothetical protein